MRLYPRLYSSPRSRQHHGITDVEKIVFPSLAGSPPGPRFLPSSFVTKRSTSPPDRLPPCCRAEELGVKDSMPCRTQPLRILDFQGYYSKDLRRERRFGLGFVRLETDWPVRVYRSPRLLPTLYALDPTVASSVNASNTFRSFSLIARAGRAWPQLLFGRQAPPRFLEQWAPVAFTSDARSTRG
jgi:hypothetical protein